MIEEHKGVDESYDPLGDGKSLVELTDHMGDDYSVVRAARVSYSGDTEKRPVADDERLIRYLAKHEHFSPFEHTSITFHVAAPLFVVRQWHRHRAFSYSEVSRRYTAEDIRFYVPLEWRVQSESNRQASGAVKDRSHTWLEDDRYLSVVQAAVEVYMWMVNERGIAREQARMVLPQSMYTRMYCTGNLRSFAHFYKLRADEHAQDEIRQYALAIGEILKELYPVSWPALTEYGAGA